jgi:hypothetical protein
MKTKAVAVTLALCLVAGTTCLANPHMGTWKLNESKSKLTPGTGKNNMVTYEAAGKEVKVTVEGVDAKDKPTRNEWTGKFDGKDYPVTGDPTSDMRSYKKIDSHSMELTVKKGGKVVSNGQIVVAADGKSRTVTISGMTPKGKKFQNVVVYDKQ